MEYSSLYLLLGSNLGDRDAFLKEASTKLEELFGKPTWKSPIIETKACGFEAPDFKNQILCFKSNIDPFEILSLCKEIERSMGRNEIPQYDSEGNRIYHNRTIDIDILKYGEITINTPTLTIPHPQVESRAFVKKLLFLQTILKN